MKSYKNKKLICNFFQLFFIFLFIIGVAGLLVDELKIKNISSIESNYKSISNIIEKAEVNTESTQTTKASENAPNSIYLSDIEYIKGVSYAGWDEIRYDQINTGAKISLKIENAPFTFKKGIWAHADSQVAYDISNYDYEYFTAYVGINTTSSRGDGVRFSIVTSEDGKNWSEPKFEEVKLPQQEATSVKINIKDAKYIILNADKIGNNVADHAVFADARLINETSETSSFKTVEEYNEIIKSQYNGQENITNELQFNLLKREFVKNIGQFTLNYFYNESEDNRNAIDWLMNNQKALNYYILGGKPLGNNYYKSLTEYSRLYRNYKNDFNDTSVTKYGTELGDLYLRMATSLSLTHSTLVGLWMNNASTPDNQSDSVRRYAIIKYMHKNGLFQAGGMDYNSWFENYTVEEMRYVMANNIDDQSMLWLNSYVRELIEKEGSPRLWPHRYVSYVWPNYANPIYYAEENKDYFNELFSVRDPNNENSGERIGLWDVVYTIPGGVDEPEYTLQIPRGTADNKIYKVWMNMRNKFGTGAVCGGISKVGANIRGVLGLPDAVVGQPGHAAHINYFQNSNGEGFWGIDNDVSGWAYTGSSILLGWSSGPYASGYTGTYIPLAQEVINHEDTYEQSQMFVYLADSYTDLTQKETAYRKALEIQPLNLNAWYGLITTYKASDNKTEEQYYELAKEIAESLKNYPLPMYQMTNQIKSELTSIGENYKFTLLQTRILNEAKDLPSNSTEVLQPGITKLMANFLLGQMDTSIATFSFDGEDAGKIVLSSRFDGNGVRWDYAINGKGENGVWDVSDFKEVSFSAEEEHKLQLTEEEIASITSENDIYIHIVGVNYAEENIYKIDINESAGLPSTLFASDLENKLLGATDTIEWKYNENDEWKRYGEEQPNLTGNKTVILRMGATQTYLASKTNTTYTFTEDVVNNKRKYIPVEHISLESVSTEATNQQGSATFALDANYNTRWHSAWNGSDTQRFITVKFDTPRNISAVEFVPAGGGNGKIYDGTIWGSMDGENWTVITQEKNLTYTNQANTVEQAMDNIKSFEIDSPQKVQYIKIVADRTNGNWIAARAFNFYEDTTIKIVASFSFDGNEAGKIKLIDSEYNKNWKYSLDGGKNWKNATGNSHQLTAEEVNIITSENGIKLKLSGDDTVYSIKVKEAEELVLNPYVNDLENRLIGLADVSNLEWKYSNTISWTSYSSEEPVVEGNKILQVRKKAIGLTLPSNTLEYEFTADNQPDTAKYIKIKHLAIHSYTSQSIDAKRPHYAPNIIDGNPNTEWHTDFRIAIGPAGAYIAIKLDSPRYISGIDYLHMDSTREPYGFMKNGKVYTSEDGESWTAVATMQDVVQDNTLKHFEFDESVYAQYVKLEIESYDNIFAAASMINLYEDITKKEAPTAEIEYSITSNTNQNVTAKLVNPSTDITITNNGGKDTYTFTENGSFTFEFEDEDGVKGTAEANVNWIIKTLPTATIVYSPNKTTNQNVTAEVSFDRAGTTIVDENGEAIETLEEGEKYTVTFTENGTREIKFVGPYGNAGSKTLKVDWIDKEAPIGTIKYSTKNPTNQDVEATIEFNEKNVTITNNGGKNKYTFTDNNEFTFEYKDAAGNTGSATAKVDWIDRKLSTATITYSTTNPTNKDVVATVTFDKEGVIVEGGNTHTFTENGTYEFNFVGPAGNKGVAVAEVTWIDKKAPTAELSYSTTGITNQDVVVTVEFDEENVRITNNNGSDKHTFTENGEFTFEYEDRAGNKGSITAFVNVIDKVAPTAEVEYNINKLTNKDVKVTLINPSENITITSEGGNTHTFTENGTFTFEFVDRAGNIGTVEAEVDWIDKESPIGTIKYSTTEITNKEVTATIEFNEENITITSKGGNTHTFTENGTFTFEYEDKAGNKGTAVAKVTWINKNAPTGTVKYSTEKPTNKNVVATLEVPEGIIITSEGGNTHTFTENGEFRFTFRDAAGNEGSTTAKVDWIDKESPIGTIKYSTIDITNKDVIATITFNEENVTITSEGRNTHTFTENGTFTFTFRDAVGNEGTATAKVTWINKNAPTGTIKYNIEGPTNQNVIATLEVAEGIEITSEGGNTHEFTENGEFRFTFRDAAGNEGSATARITWIDKETPIGTISYSTTNKTNKNVVATITFNEENVVVSGETTVVFSKNGKYTFIFRDAAGNIGTTEALVTWINKEAPTGTIKYSTDKVTNKDVIATLEVAEGVTITSEGGNKHIFTENSSFEFKFIDEYGNEGRATATVTWINKNIPTGTIKYSTDKVTNKDVIATLEVPEGITITSEGGNTHTFTTNGSFTFIFRDAAGNEGRATATVNWIDKIAPTGKIEYNVTTPTSSNVTASITFSEEKVKITSKGGNTHTFTENGEFVFEFVDEAGNVGTAIAKVTWISKEKPTGTIKYSTDKVTNKDVIATLEVPEGITITSEGGNTHTFTANGEFIFTFRDDAGNEGSAIARVDWIDTTTPIGTIKYQPTSPTNKNVVATITFNEENVIVEGGNTHVFTENGEYTFKFRDAAGNEGTLVAKVDWINKNAPTGVIKYDIEKVTNKDVIATLEVPEGVTITSEGGNTHTFTKNGSFTFTFKDEYGNIGTAVATVDWIDKEAPVGTVKYSITELTNKNVVATITFNEENVTITSCCGDTHLFGENGEFVFTFKDAAGNEGSAVAKVDWIDTATPIGTIKYQPASPTNKNVVATITFNEENVIVEGGNTHVFTENGEYTFIFRDAAGNEGSLVAKVDWIDKESPVGIVKYSTEKPTNQNVVATLEVPEGVTITSEGGNTHTFTKNGEFVFTFRDAAGNEGSLVARVDWIDKVAPIGTISYDISNKTNKNVTATITFNEENVEIINKEGNKFTFTENGEFEFEFIDKAGNKGTAIAKVTWIKKEVPTGTIKYNINKLTNKDVIAILEVPEGVTITSEGRNTYKFTQNGEFTFTFKDEYGNEGSAIARVNWIDKEAPIVTVKYNIYTTTSGEVIATVTANEDIDIINNNHINTYVFKENGEFVFEVVDKAGNKGTAVAKVTWIKKENNPTNNNNYQNNNNNYNNGVTTEKEDNNKKDNNKDSNDSKEDNKDKKENIEYKNSNIKVTALLSNLDKNYSLSADKFDLKDEFDSDISGINDSYRLSIKSANGKEIDVSSEIFKIKLPIRIDKKVKSVYKMYNNSTIEVIDNYTIEGEFVEFEDEGLDSYIINYEEDKINSINWKLIIIISLAGIILIYPVIEKVLLKSEKEEKEK